MKISTKAQSLLKNGVQSTGNLFLVDEEPIQKLKSIEGIEKVVRLE